MNSFRTWSADRGAQSPRPQQSCASPGPSVIAEVSSRSAAPTVCGSRRASATTCSGHPRDSAASSRRPRPADPLWPRGGTCYHAEMNLKLVAALLASVWCAGIMQSVRADQGAGTTTWSGVYTEEQAKTGAAVYAKNCSECHLED